MGYEEAMDWMKDDADRREDEAEELATLRRELTEAQRDGERLEFLMQSGWRVVSTSPKGDYRLKDSGGDFRTGWYDDPRYAIDAAMPKRKEGV